MPTGYANLTIDEYAGLTIDNYAAMPLEGTSGGVGTCLYDAAKIAAILAAVQQLQTDINTLKSEVTAIKNRVPTTGTLATADNVTAVITAGDARWKTATGFATSTTPMTLSTAYDAAKSAASAANVTTAQSAIISACATATGFATPTNITTAQTAIITACATATGFATPAQITAAQEAIIQHGNGAWSSGGNGGDSLTPAQIGEAVWQSYVGSVNQTLKNQIAPPITTETVNVSTQTVDLSGVNNTLSAIKTSTDRIPQAPAAAGNIPTAADIAAAVGRRQVTATPPLLSQDGLILAALSSVTEPSVGNPAAGTLRVKNPDGSTLGTLTLGVEPASSAKVITGVNP